jgi:hypothetical protein
MMMIDFFLERICRRKKKKDEGAFSFSRGKIITFIKLINKYGTLIYDPIGDAFERVKSARDNFDLVLLTCFNLWRGWISRTYFRRRGEIRANERSNRPIVNAHHVRRFREKLVRECNKLDVRE